MICVSLARLASVEVARQRLNATDRYVTWGVAKTSLPKLPKGFLRVNSSGGTYEQRRPRMGPGPRSVPPILLRAVALAPPALLVIVQSRLKLTLDGC
jgi:hypothetical protein